MRLLAATLSAGCLLVLALVMTPAAAQQYRPRSDLGHDRAAGVGVGQASVESVGRDWLDLNILTEPVHSPRAFAAGAHPLDDPTLYDERMTAAKYSRGQQPTASSPLDDDWRAKCAQRCDERMMDVTGVGVESIATSQAEVRVTVEYRKMLVNATNQPLQVQPEDAVIASLISTVQQEVSRKATAVVEYLQKSDAAQYVTKLRTSGLTLEAQNEWINNRMILNGYRAANSIIFRVDIPMAGTVVDAIVERGVTRIDGINFVATPKELNAARHVAITSAVDDAISQALSALSGLGKVMTPLKKTDLHIVRLDVIGVTRPEADAIAPMAPGAFGGASPRAAAMMTKSFESAPAPIEGDEKSVTATVALKIRF